MEKRPRIAALVDTHWWAWGYKAAAIKKYLNGDFHVDIISVSSPEVLKLREDEYDLYLAFGFALAEYMLHIPKQKKIIGVTAHRKKDITKQLKTCGWYHANSILLWNELVHKWEFPKERTFYVPNGVDDKLFNLLPLTKEDDFGFVGKDVPAKNWKFVKEAATCAGVTLFSHISNHKDGIPLILMSSIYRQFNCLIVASEDDGTPNPALEAAACGRPIISNRIGNMPEFIIDIRKDQKRGNGILLDSIDLQSYVDSIKYFRDNPDLLYVAGINARMTVELEWTWKRQIENYRHMFRTILGENRD